MERTAAAIGSRSSATTARETTSAPASSSNPQRALPPASSLVPEATRSLTVSTATRIPSRRLTSPGTPQAAAALGQQAQVLDPGVALDAA